MAAICRLSSLHTLKRGMNLLISPKIKCRAYTTLPKKSEIACETDTTEKKKQWFGYGFSEDNEAIDRFTMHEAFFVIITVVTTIGGFALLFKPNSTHADWAQREAYLQLRYREENGLPLIDPNFIDPSKFTLPTDEELGDTEIII